MKEENEVEGQKAIEAKQTKEKSLGKEDDTEKTPFEKMLGILKNLINPCEQ